METSRHLDVLEERSSYLLELAATGMDKTVPDCPEWTVADLVHHIGSAWGWAAETVATGSRGTYPEPAEGTTGDDLIAWAAEQARAAHDALINADLDSDIWTFGLPRTPRFWARRQALESTLHAHDVEGALGHPRPMDGDVSSDGIDEFLTVMVTRWVGRHPADWSGQTFHLHRTDGDGEWLIRLGPEGEVDAQRTHAKGDIALRGPASDLWLWAAGRLDLGRSEAVEVLGDPSLAGRWSANITF